MPVLVTKGRIALSPPIGGSRSDAWSECLGGVVPTASENTHLYGPPPTLNNVGARLGELVRVRRKDGSWRECKYLINGHPPLFRTQKKALNRIGGEGTDLRRVAVPALPSRREET